jgi:hypothetical protein
VTSNAIDPIGAGCGEREDRTKDDADARGPRSGKRDPKQHAPDSAARGDREGASGAIERRHPDDASEVEPARYDCQSQWELHNLEDARDGTTRVGSADAKEGEEQREAADEEERVNEGRLMLCEPSKSANIGRNNWQYARREEAERAREKGDKEPHY